MFAYVRQLTKTKRQKKTFARSKYMCSSQMWWSGIKVRLERSEGKNKCNRSEGWELKDGQKGRKTGVSFRRKGVGGLFA